MRCLFGVTERECSSLIFRPWFNWCPQLCKHRSQPASSAHANMLKSNNSPLIASTNLVHFPAAVRTLRRAPGGAAVRWRAGWWRLDGCSPDDSFYQDSGLVSEEHLTSPWRRVDCQLKPYPSGLDALLCRFVATVNSNSFSSDTAARLGPKHDEPLRAGPAPWSVLRSASTLRFRGSVLSVLHQAAADNQWQLKKFLCKLSQSHPHRWVDLRQRGLSSSRTGSLKGNATKRN